MLFVDVIDGDKTKTINIPTDWEDMTLDYWCGIYKIFKKYKDNSESNNKPSNGGVEDELRTQTNQLTQANMDFLRERDAIKLNKELFKYIAQISDSDIELVDMSQAVKVLQAINILQEEYKPKGTNSFEFEGEIYYFPSDNMKGNTFGDYIESSQLDMNQESMVNGHYDVLPEQMAILCRRIGEEYDEDEIKIKAEKFRYLKMDIILEFSFFLTKQSLALNKVLEMYLEEKEEVVEV
tara:strand:- start:1247 stop:1957 length:711 start_codon:yes stop_codon:yes gene_type:complete